LLRRRSRRQERSSGEPAAPPPAANRSENRDISGIDTLQQQRPRGTLLPNVRQYKFSGTLFITEAGIQI